MKSKLLKIAHFVLIVTACLFKIDFIVLFKNTDSAISASRQAFLVLITDLVSDNLIHSYIVYLIFGEYFIEDF